MQVKTNLMGAEQTLEISQEQIFAFEPGLGGFPGLRRYALIAEPDSAVEWLQSLEDPNISFALIEPFLFQPEYAFELPDRDAEALGMRDPGDALVRCVLTLDEDPEQITANLMAPLLLCRRTHLARQVVLQDGDQPLRARLFVGLDGAASEPDERQMAAGA